MAVPTMAPARMPPKIPAPTTQPTQPAFAGAGAAKDKQFVHVFS